jgi:hypothetical protein
MDTTQTPDTERMALTALLRSAYAIIAAADDPNTEAWPGAGPRSAL